MRGLAGILTVSALLLSSAAVVNPQRTTAQARRRGRVVARQKSRAAGIKGDAAVSKSRSNKTVVDRLLKPDDVDIVGGKKAKEGAFPWHVSIGDYTDKISPYSAHICGGSVYSDRWIITAAHCFENRNTSQLYITTGTNSLIFSARRVKVNRVILHKDFVIHRESDGGKWYDNDIALLELSEPLPLGERIKTVPLLTPDVEETFLTPDTKFVVAGWGWTRENGAIERNLRYLDDIPLVARAICNQQLFYNGRITNNMICAGFASGGKDSCGGDSGGGLMVKASTATTLAGVVSWGEGCARENKVGVYTRVANYVQWIGDCTSNSPMCNQ